LRITQPIDFSHQAGSILVLAQPTVVFHFFSPAVSILPEAFASSIRQLLGRRGQSSVGTEDSILLH